MTKYVSVLFMTFFSRLPDYFTTSGLCKVDCAECVRSQGKRWSQNCARRKASRSAKHICISVPASKPFCFTLFGHGRLF